ncbi:U3 small nucleolar RNA-associated protein 17 [Cyphellophora attinorum]|uniref:U3 small nucleolar RNA-associated protein 17 n=1 Tax=Cyphellophora attinorum TaxID=1664694 RepID=A0A0N1HU26_9EURO|nr:U3 small nucleolar RNA-associated protein 17 [Phialophora attinorum]KPI42756.1 U3 small nucleolar RNA-associated protein 17 [Phialophora attinorum]
MSQGSKRKATEAFEAVQDHEQQTSKKRRNRKNKHKRQESGDNDDAAQQLQRESQQSGINSPSPVGDPAFATSAVRKPKRRKSKRKDQPSSEASPPVETSDERRDGEPTEPLGGDDHLRQNDDMHGRKEPESQRKRKKNRRGGKRLNKHADQDKDISAGLEARIERPEVVDLAQIAQALERVSNSSDDVASVERLAKSRPLEDRIEKPTVPKKRRKHRPKSRPDEALVSDQEWSLSDATAGSFLIQDPLLTDDDKHVILPTRNGVRIYSAATSLLVRTLSMGHRTISTCTFAKSDPAILFVGNTDGTITQWDWTSGRLLHQWKSSKGLRRLISMISRGPADSELVIALHDPTFEDRRLIVYALDPDNKKATNIQLLMSRTGLNPEIQLFEEAGIIIVSALSRLIIGSSTSFQIPNYTQSTPTWREFPLPSNVSCVDGRVSDVQAKPPRKRLDVVVGLNDGSILLYEDLLHKLVSKEKKKEGSINARSLNWHRAAVNTAKWSRDGNYVISGGSETVLVIWQLDTNKQQFLPHLSTDIVRLTVSKRGSSYALHLGDNSIMVLSTSDLSPTANIALLAGGRALNGRMPTVADHTKAGHLLAAVPRANTSSDQTSILQTYDFSSDMQISRQALTRNLTTTVNVGPEGQQIKEPSISHLGMSYEGRWLMTTEQWRPAVRDSSGVLLAEDADSSRRGFETSLRFWSRNEDENDWELVNRVDQPHESSKILALSQNPARVEFATTASDGTVLYWTPKARRRDGVPVRNQSGQQLYNWGVARAVSCVVGSNITAAALSYSQDGSVVAASYMTSAGPQWTYLIPDAADLPMHGVTALFNSIRSSIATTFVDQHLLTLTSTSFTVYDTVNSSIIKSISLGGDLSLQSESKCHHLAANPLDGTFALGLNPSEDILPGRVLVFDLRAALDDLDPSLGTSELHDVTSPAVLFDGLVDGQITSLLASPTSPGYIVIDSSSEIRQVRAGFSSSRRSKSGPGYKQDSFKGLDAIFGKSSPAEQSEAQSQPPALDTDVMEIDEEVTAGRPKTIDNIFGFQSSTEVPSVHDLFERVVSLFRKPEAQWSTTQTQVVRD